MKNIKGYTNRQICLLNTMTLYCDKKRNIDEIMRLAGLTNKEKTLMHLLNLYEQGFVSRIIVEETSERYYFINEKGKAAFNELLEKYKEDFLDECMAKVEMEDAQRVD